MRSAVRYFVPVITGCVFFWGIQAGNGAEATPEAQDPQGVQFFEKHIRPVLIAKCYSCHSADSKEIKGGLVLDTREGIRRGGETGPAVVPKNIEDSILIEALKHEGLEMPPDEKLSDDVIARFEQWVKMGAPDPRDGKTSVIKREIDFVKAREFWSFQPIANPQPPKVADASWVRTDIDRFVGAKLEAKGIKPVADADPLVLVRRMYFDLIGMPPTPAQIDEFVQRYQSQPRAAVSELTDRLLATPQFGERWGRHWLDVVRFAESTGMERNFTYPHAWRYRNYVIKSFNDDKPFDQFVREQVAGDLLPAKSEDQRRDQLTATAFLAIGPKSLNERNREQFAMDIVDEQLDTTFRSVMGLTAGCARCHDHKFDPIPTKEYYSLAGIFRSTDVYYGTANVQGNRQVGQLLAWAKGDVQPVSMQEATNKKGKAATGDTSGAADALKEQLKNAEQQLARIKSRSATASGDKKRKAAKLLEETEATVAKLREKVEAATKVAKGNGKGKKDKASSSESTAELLMAVLDSKSPKDTQLRVRGEPDDRGDTIPRGFLTMGTTGGAPKVGQGSGRLELADYLTQKDNPLTARVAANRVWQHLIGRGLVASVDNFGIQGDRPTHPELLDYLATDLAANRWSIKHLIRTIVNSRVYQLAGTGSEQAEAIDPANDLMWRSRHRRLEVEALRDAMLVASGQLDLSPPENGSVVADIGDGDVGRGINSARFSTSSPKRSVYLPIVRLALPDMFQVFDFPEPSNISGQRDVTTVATQALYLMNSPFALDQAGVFARKLLDDTKLTDGQRVELAYRSTLARLPSDEEKSEALKFVADAQKSLTKEFGNNGRAPSRAWTAVCQALFASAEFRYLE